jgi:hypothetical protein
MVAAVGAAAGYSAHEYLNGEAFGVAGAGVDQTYHATLKAIERHGLAIASQNRGVASADFRCTDPEHTQIDISLRRRSADMTAITVKVGIFGDEARSRAIINSIKDSL